MFLHKVFLAVLLIACVVCIAQAKDNMLVGTIIGRTGDIIRISVPQPVSEGAVFDVKPIEREQPIAQARVLNCTDEQPYEVVARVIRTDLQTNIPIGVHAYVDTDQVKVNGGPKPIARKGLPKGGRFSLQAGAFYPSADALRSSTSDFWQSYRINYSFLRVGVLEATLSAEYLKGFGDFISGTDTGKRQLEIIPVTLMGRIKPFRLGSSWVFFGAGAGYYRIRSEETLGATTTLNQSDQFGQEYSAGLESAKGWILEARYRNVPNTEIKGYSLALGTRF